MAKIFTAQKENLVPLPFDGKWEEEEKIRVASLES